MSRLQRFPAGQRFVAPGVKRIGFIRPVAIALGCAAALWVTAASAAPSCMPSGMQVVCTFSTPGSEAWTVPGDVTQITAVAYGAAGGATSVAAGGLGGQGTAALAVTPGEVLQVNVGGAGGNRGTFVSNGGVNGGGSGGAGFLSISNGPGGGGASDVRAGAFGLADRFVVGGGGGGAGDCCGASLDAGGAGGGLTGGNGGAGQGGTQFSGGAGSGNGTSGSLGLGGAGGFIPVASGGSGGGGGYYGGGGSGAGSSNRGSAGGGSGFGSTLNGGVRSGNGLVTITYAGGELRVVKSLSPASDPGRFNLQIDGSTQVTDAGDGGNTGLQTVTPGTHTVGETAGTATSLADYTSVIECRDNDGAGASVASGSGAGPLSVPIATGAQVACMITNIRQTGQLRVVKSLSPAADPGRFNLQINGVTQVTDAGNGGNTGLQTVNTGTYTVGETAGTATTLAVYTSAIECRDGNGAGAVVASGAGAGPLNVPVSSGAQIACTITNIRDALPTVTINQAVGQGDPASASPITFTVVFSEPVTGFTGTDVTFAGSTVGGTLAAAVSGAGAAYTVTVTGMTTSGNVVASIPASAAQDPVGNPSVASTSTDNTVAYVDAPPTITINQAAGQADPATGSPIAFTVTFSEPVTGFTAADVSFAGSTVGGTLAATVSGSGASYTVSVTGMSGNGVVVADIPAGAASDPVGNSSVASTSTDNTVTFGSAPSVTINQAAGQADPANAAPVSFTVVFNQPVTGFTNTDVSFAGSTVSGTLAASVTGTGASYTVTIAGMTGNGTVVASIPAGAATNGAFTSLASTSTDNSVAFDGTAPTATINQAVGQPDPAGTSPILFTVGFSEPVTGFIAADVSLTGSTATGTLVASVSGSGASYTVSVTGMAGSGTVVASIPASAAVDLAGNASAAATSSDSSVTFVASNTIFTGPSATGTGNITASFAGGGPTCNYGTARFIAPPPGAAPVPPVFPPVAVFFPHGLFDFTTTGCTPGVTLAFTITYPSPLPAGTQYWKYGPEAGNTTPHWYLLPATIAGNVVTFSITDGGQGDDDLAANGTIVDQGGPGAPPAVGPIQTPTLDQWALLLMALLMGGFAAIGLRAAKSER